ncbi:hypothetical protein BCV71DRAFT_185876 [Rhizopus microsporus]|uniref:Resolvase/invertase-type recombinase catalytic domain-containing protein n=1 Tax=Rhizopus microsporus TaxID=58291 RepID=A0A1X0RT62_RHIZD|nr:hypothetical protein BCV71DRAFT_185876 [Rhizopus microsporus]
MIVGYARNSMTDEDNSTRQRLLNGMVTKLKTKLLCRKVFVSPCSSADMEFSKRDTSKKSLKFMESFKSSFMIDLLLFLKAETRMVRLIAIDYAGLSTNVEDLRSLVNNHKCVKEIVIDKGHRVELFSRKQLLKDDEVLRLFRCRTKAVNRSS